MTTLKEILQSVLDPATAERLAAHKLVDRYKKIKPALSQLGVTVTQDNHFDTGDKRWITTYTVSCGKENAGAVKALLNRAHIKDLTQPSDVRRKAENAGLLAQMNTEQSLNMLNNQINTYTYIIYRGKFMSFEDSNRLRSVPNKVT